MFFSTAFGKTPSSGWLQKARKGYVYFKPFVKLKAGNNRMVIFVTSNGKIYKGRCRTKNAYPKCIVTPGKKFDSPYNEIRYIILKISNPLPPEIKKTGIIENSIIKE